MNVTELQSYIDAAGGKIAFAARIDITVRYIDMLLAEDRVMSKELEELTRLKIALPPTVK
jgi:hypothetical protein